MKTLRIDASSFLDEVVQAVKSKLEGGYYDLSSNAPHRPVSLRDAILYCGKIPVITEIKFYSPARGVLGEPSDVEGVAQAMVRGGAVGISVLTETTFFQGSLGYLQRARRVTEVPLLMKDFIIDQRQVDAAASVGADAVLLISTLYDAASTRNIREMVDYVHQRGLEVLLEVHSRREFYQALQTDADMIGINNRDLRSLKTSLSTTEDILRSRTVGGRVIISESGFNDAEQLKKFRAMGVSGFLIGSAVMKSKDIELKVRSLVGG